MTVVVETTAAVTAENGMNGIYTLAEVAWQTTAQWPLLTLLQILPLVGMGLMLLLNNQRLSVIIALVTTAVEMALIIHLYSLFDAHNPAMQFAESWPFLSSYHVAVDGLSVLFLLLTGFLFLLMMIYIVARQMKELTRLLAILLTIEAILVGLFSTMNLMWFGIYSVIELAFLTYLISHWASSPQKELARIRFVQFMGTASIIFFLGVMLIGWNYVSVTGAPLSFDLFDLVNVSIPMPLQSIVFFALFFGLAIRTPFFPMHGWWPVVAAHGNIAIAPVVILGVKVGVYGIFRFIFPLMPEAVSYWQPVVVGLAVTGVFYAAILAFMQKNLRNLLAFAVISHSSLLLLGLFSLEMVAFEGSVLLSLDFALATTGLLFMSAFVFRRTNSLLLSRLGGLFETIPIVGVAFLLAGLSIIGMPGTPGFDAVHLILEATMKQFGAPISVLAALGNVVAAGFLLWAFQRAFLTQKEGGLTEKQAEITTPLERVVAIIIIASLLITGFYSETWLGLVELPLEGLDALYNS